MHQERKHEIIDNRSQFNWITAGDWETAFNNIKGKNHCLVKTKVDAERPVVGSGLRKMAPTWIIKTKITVC